jgi:hypothetical protein
MIKRVHLFESWLNEEAGKFEISHQKFNELTDEMLKYAKKVLNAKNFNAYTSSKASAQIEWTWFQGNVHEKRPVKEPKFTLSGWHGSSSYGSGKMITGIFIDNLPGTLKFEQIAQWEFPHASEISEFSNRAMTAYTKEAYESYQVFLKEVKQKIDEAPKLPVYK